jgi:AcrR family transcriptional regulator
MPKIVDHDDYRKEMLDKCFSLFSTKGYANITMKEIAAEIGVSTGTLYHYFPTKESILGQMISRAGEINTAEYISRAETTGSAADRFMLMIDFWKEKGEYYKNLMLLSIDMKRTSTTEESEIVFRTFSDHYTEIIAEKLNLSPEFARSIFIHIMGLVLHSILTPRFLDYEEEIDRFSELIKPFIKENSNDK